MKLANVFLITALVGVFAAIGCSDDPPPQNGNGGSGGTAGSGGAAGSGGTAGSGSNVCTGPRCDNDADQKADCQAGVTICIEEEFLEEEECPIGVTAIFCSDLGSGGSGGAGGGVDPGLVCDTGLCEMDDDLKAACEEIVRDCLIYCENEECREEDCGILGLFKCNVEGG